MRPASLLLLALLTLSLCTPKADTSAALPGRPVPAAWVEKLRRYQYQTDNLALLREFERIMAPDTLAGARDLPHEGGSAEPGGELNLLFVNLDPDPASELIGLFSYNHHDYTLAVFQEIDHAWRLLYTEPFETHGIPAELQVANTFSAHKPFYIRAVLGRGSGVYFSRYQFYKLIDRKVYPCLQLADRTFDQGQELSKEVHAKLQFSATRADELQVSYDYRFDGSYGLLPGNSRGGLASVSFVQDSRDLGYHWNDTARRYEPDKPLFLPDTGALADSADLNAAKAAYFTDTDNDSLFIRAFGYELRQLRREGSPAQKMLLRQYLAAVRQDARRQKAARPK